MFDCIFPCDVVHNLRNRENAPAYIERDNEDIPAPSKSRIDVVNYSKLRLIDYSNPVIKKR